MAKSAPDRTPPPAAAVVFRLPENIAHWAPSGAAMLMSASPEVDGVGAGSPWGRLAIRTTLRGVLARRHRATMTYPLIAGMVSSIVLRAAVRRALPGFLNVTPYWRVVRSGGPLNPRCPAASTTGSHVLAWKASELRQAAGRNVS